MSESLHREVIFKHDWFIIPFKPVETFTIINFWNAVLSRIPYFREELKDIASWAERVITPGEKSEQTVSKPWQSSTWLVDNRNKGPTRFYFFYLPDRAISTKKWNNSGNKKENLYLTFLLGCSSVSSWLWATPIQTSYLIGPYNLHYRLFSGIGTLLCHNPYCFPSQSQTLFGIGAGRPPITAVAR